MIERRKLESPKRSGFMDFSFKKVSFILSKRGYGSYIEIFNEWNLDDYDQCMQIVLKENKQNG